MIDTMATQRADLQRLIEEIESLAPEDRKTVISALSEKTPAPKTHRGVSPQHFRQLIGIFSIGGDAVEKCESLYDV